VHNDDVDSAAVDMTSQPGEVDEEERQQDGSQGATSAADRVELADKKDAITDGVIRQLIDQIAQLQRVSDSHCLLTLQQAMSQLQRRESASKKLNPRFLDTGVAKQGA